jgi:hypothetical protein
MSAHRPSRAGTVLVLVSGCAALIVALTTAFLWRVREAAADTAVVVAEAQARVMLLAACDYVLEASRLGYDQAPRDPARPHEEGYGWIDVRDGATGPRDHDRNPLWSSGAWPAVGATARCPMEVLRRTPYAIRLTTAYNPIESDPAAARFGVPLLTAPDPQPAHGNGWPGAIDPGAYDAYAAGDRRPRPESVGLAWFRVHREEPARFVVTCGAGASRGFRDWPEVVAAGEAAAFVDQASFAEIVAAERRLWYRIEWSAWIGNPSYFHFIENELRRQENYLLHPHNATQCSPTRSQRSQIRRPNPVGTIRWVERLYQPPAQW